MLYLVLKWRNLDVRKKTIDMLKQAPFREDMWIRSSILELAEWNLGEEEECCTALPPNRPLPNVARIYCETGRGKVVDRRTVTVVGYNKGAVDPNDDNVF
jgi:hypothetical protein